MDIRPSMDIRPLHDRIIVRRVEEGEQHIGGIIIPDSTKEKPQRGTVTAGANPMAIKRGIAKAVEAIVVSLKPQAKPCRW
jgi:chaperonin GroES